MINLKLICIAIDSRAQMPSCTDRLFKFVSFYFYLYLFSIITFVIYGEQAQLFSHQQHPSLCICALFIN